MMRLCCQEQHLPGATLEDKFATAVEYGFDGIELRGAGDLAFEARLPELISSELSTRACVRTRSPR